MIIHVFGKVQGPTSTGNLHDGYFKTFSGPVRIQATCDMTLHLEGVHICHILKYWLQRLYRVSSRVLP